jgi:membrane protein implicated in regulation of membrane protease activity
MKILFYMCVCLAIYFLAGIVKIIAFDMDRLTQYGWGYFTGQLVLLVLFSAVSFILVKKVYRPVE